MSYEGRLVAIVETKGAAQSANELDNFAKSADNAENKTNSLKSALPGISNAFKAGLTAAAAFTGAMSALAIKAAENEDKFSDLAKIAGVTTSELKAMAFAFGTAGVSVESLAETSRKTLKELGQFQATGAGGFKDILEVLKGKSDLTAESLRGLSGVDVLQKLKNELDAANVPLEQQQFLIDGVARGAGALIPILANQGSEIASLTERYNSFNDQLKISSTASDELAAQADNFDLLKASMSNAATYLASEFTPEIEAAMTGATQLAVDAAHALATFFDTFRAPENQRNIDAVQVNITKTAESLDLYKKKLSESTYATTEYNVAFRKTAELTKELEELNARKLELQKQNDEQAKKSLGGGDVGTNSALDTKLANDKEKFIQFMAQLNEIGRTELQVIDIQERELLSALDKFHEQGMGSAEQYEQGRTRIIMDAAQKRADVADKSYQLQEQMQEQHAARLLQQEERNNQAKQGAQYFLNQMNQLGIDQFALIDEQAAQRMDKLRELSNQGLIEYADFEQAKTKILDEQTQQRQAYENAQNQAIFAGASSLFGSLADLQAAFGSKQGETYRALFAISKAFAIAQAGLSIAAAAQALADPTAITLPQKLANYGIITGAVGTIATSVAGVNFNPREQGGQFRAGQRLLVGERGPELVEFGSGGRIDNKPEAQVMPKVTIINNTTGRIDTTNVQMDRGEMIIIAREVLNDEVMKPNSRFNKNLDATRTSQRRI